MQVDGTPFASALLASALTKVVAASCLTAGETAVLLASAFFWESAVSVSEWTSSMGVDFRTSAWVSLSQPTATPTRAERPVALCVARLVRAEAARLEKNHTAAVELGTGGGVRLAVAALRSLPPCASDHASDDELRVATEGAAALANLTAAAGANKLVALESGAIGALLGCAERWRAAHAASAAGASPLHGALCVQACRALGNLCYGDGVEQLKRAIAADGAAAVVAAVRCAAGPILFRWQAHALRNLAVRSPPMQAAIAASGGLAALCGGLRRHLAHAPAQEAGCKALAFTVRGCEANCAAAAATGATELAVLALTTHGSRARVAEAALMLLCCVVGSSGRANAPGEDARARAAVAVAACAHLAALAALQAALLPTVGRQRSTGGSTGCIDGAEEGDGEEEKEGDAHSGAQVVWWGAMALAAMLTALPSGASAIAAEELERGGLRRLMATEAAQRAQRRGRIRSDVQRCLSLLAPRPFLHTGSAGHCPSCTAAAPGATPGE